MERRVLAQPLFDLLVPAAMAAAWYARQRAAKEGELEIGLSFDCRRSPSC